MYSLCSAKPRMVAQISGILLGVYRAVDGSCKNALFSFLVALPYHACRFDLGHQLTRCHNLTQLFGPLALASVNSRTSSCWFTLPLIVEAVPVSAVVPGFTSR
jgi:hypothetical protein